MDLLTPEVLAKVNDLVVREGLSVAGKSSDDALAGRVKAYLRLCAQLTYRVTQTVKAVRARQADGAATVSSMLDDTLMAIEQFVADADMMRGQIVRRALRGEAIASHEKLFSVFERFTRWISRGKAGRPVELGVPLTILEEASGFVLAWQLQWQGGDVDAAVPVVEAATAVHPTLASCRFGVFDVQGFHSPANQRNLRDLLSFVTLPVKGRGNAATQAHETSDAFQAARKQHPAVESAIHALECHGLARIRNRCQAGFERTVALSILGANLHRLGVLLQCRARKRKKRLSLAA